MVFSPFVKFDIHFFIFLRIAQAVDAGNRCDDDDIFSRQECLRRCVAKPVDLFVDHRFLFDIGVGDRHVRLRLIVVVV